MDVRVSGLTLDYNGVAAVQDMNLYVQAGTTLVLLGPSGCGKSSTMRSIAGLETPRCGTITIGNRIVFDANAGVNIPPHKRNLGMVFQSYAIWPHLTVYDNVAFPLRMQKIDRRERRERVDSTLVMLGLEGLAAKGASLLSGGQMQRVALARSLVMRPDVLLLDEPLSNLDARLRERLRIELRTLQRNLGLTCIYVTHDQVEAMALGDQLVVMERGGAEQTGSPPEVYRRPATGEIARFLGVENIYRVDRVVRVDDGRFEAICSDHPVAFTVPGPIRQGEEMVVCIRAEDVVISSGLMRVNGNTQERENNFAGKVTLVSFEGPSTRYEVELRGGMKVRVVATRSSGYTPVADENVTLTIPPECAQVLAAGAMR